MVKFYKIMMVSLLSIGSMVLEASIPLVSQIQTCLSGFSATNNSYQMKRNETVYSISHGLSGESVNMYVPVPQPTSTVSSLPQYALISSDLVPEKSAAGIMAINEALAAGDSAIINYTIQADFHDNYSLSVTVQKGSSSALIFSATPIVLQSAIKGSGSVQTQTDKYSASSKVLPIVLEAGKPAVPCSLEPAIPYSIPMVFAINNVNNVQGSGVLCFSGAYDSSLGNVYSAQFTFLPSVNKPTPKLRHTEAYKIIYKALKSTKTSSQRAENIANALKLQKYTIAQWTTLIVPALKALKVIDLKDKIFKLMNLPKATDDAKNKNGYLAKK